MSTQRSVSVKGETHARLSAYCKANNAKMSELVDRLVNEYIDAHEPKKT